MPWTKMSQTLYRQLFKRAEQIINCEGSLEFWVPCLCIYEWGFMSGSSQAFYYIWTVNLQKSTDYFCKFRAKQEQSFSPSKLGKTGSLGIQDHMAWLRGSQAVACGTASCHGGEASVSLQAVMLPALWRHWQTPSSPKGCFLYFKE